MAKILTFSFVANQAMKLHSGDQTEKYQIFIKQTIQAMKL